ncbi:hypothetical protein WS73_07645 [Burkholderia savannae]|nr:hypothetical protein WS73_07645 [Burkholderia savannae]
MSRRSPLAVRCARRTADGGRRAMRNAPLSAFTRATPQTGLATCRPSAVVFSMARSGGRACRFSSRHAAARTRISNTFDSRIGASGHRRIGA